MDPYLFHGYLRVSGCNGPDYNSNSTFIYFETLSITPHVTCSDLNIYLLQVQLNVIISPSGQSNRKSLRCSKISRILNSKCIVNFLFTQKSKVQLN